MEYHSSLLKLEALTGVSPCEPKGSLGEAKTYLDPDKFDLEPNLGELKGSASVRYLQRLCSLAKSRASSYRKSQYPQLKGVLSSDRMGESWSDGQNDWRAGLQLSWSPDLQNSARSRAYGEEEEALACTQDIENMLRARVEQWKNLKLEQSTLSEQLALQIEILLDSDENYKAILQSYKLGRVVVTKVVEARLVTTRAKLDDLQLKWRRDLLVYRWQRWLE